MKKKLRKIIIQNHTFWWKADWFYHADDSRIIRVRVWGEDKTGSPLYVNLTSKYIEYLVYSSYPKPKDIAKVIAYALTHGWNPFTRGEPYWLKEGIDSIELDDFFVTDVGRLVDAPGPLPRKKVSPLGDQEI